MIINYFCNFCKYFKGLKCDKNHLMWKVMEENKINCYCRILESSYSQKERKIVYIECTDYKEKK